MPLIADDVGGRVYGSGIVPITKMIRSGVAFDVAGAAVIIILLPLTTSLLGLGT